MAAPGSYSAYKTNVGRSVTKKWKDANQINYDGDDWGDDDDDGYDNNPSPAAVSADNPRHPGWDSQSNRSFTNPIPPSYAPPPAPSQNHQRPSFDRGADERRYFSTGSGFDSAYPSTQRDPFPEPQHEYDIPVPAYRDQPPLRLNTQGPPPSNTFRPGSRGRQYPPYDDAPLSAPSIFSQQQRRSGSSSRPPPAEIFQRHESPMRPESRGSTTSARHFPPRKASLGQPSPDLSRPANDSVTSSSPIATSPATGDRPIPTFIRPSDIYKRMPEEVEKARASQDSSSRPSVDSTGFRPQPETLDIKSISSEPRDTLAEDSDSTRRLKSTLDPVPERKSEYGLDNLLNPSSTQAPSAAVDSPTELTEAGIARHPTNASSVYTDRPDPVSASTVSRNQSMHEGIPEEPLANRMSYGLPAIGRMSSFGMDLGALGSSASDTSRHIPPTPSLPPPPPPVPQKDDSALDRAAAESQTQPLQHQPSLGYRSMVQQAFDDSQKDTSFSPTSTTNSVYRSNSTSTSDISPIISHKPHSLATLSATPGTYAVIPEEPSQLDSRRNTTESLRAEAPSNPQLGISHPVSIRPEFSRVDTPPTQDIAPTKRSTNIESLTSPESEHASVAAVNEYLGAPAKGESCLDEPTTAPASAGKSLPPVLAPQADTAAAAGRSASEEWKEWQAHRNQFKVQAGLQDSGPTTPHIPSPITRSESPPKGTVRGIAGKLESNSGRSSPSNVNITDTSPPSAIPEPTRPAPEPRQDSFRPAIPGGWQSYTSTATSDSIKAQPAEPSARPSPLAAHRSDTTESIPTAKAPAREANDGISKTAFAAAASAGTALASAFAGQPQPDRVAASKSPTRSEVSSENEWDASSSDDEDELPAGPSNEASLHDRSISPIRPSTPPALAPRPLVAASTPSSIATASESDRPRSEPIDYPAPLRTSRILDSSPMSRPPIPNVALSTASTNEDNDRLQHEIVKSLTPKSSNIEGESLNHGPVAHPTSERGSSTYERPDTVQKLEQPSSANQAGQIPFSSPPPPITTSDQPTTSSSAQGAPLAQRPHLQQRFSWETTSDKTPPTTTPKQLSPTPTGSPDTIRELIQPVSSISNPAGRSGPFDRSTGQQSTTSERPPVPLGPNQPTLRQTDWPQQPFVQSGSLSSQPAVSALPPTWALSQPQPQPTGAQQSAEQAEPSKQHQYPESDSMQPQLPKDQPSIHFQSLQERQTTPRSPTTGAPPMSTLSNVGNNEFSTNPPQRQYPTSDPASFRSIMALSTPHERILAFNESRQAHATSDGQLEGWLSSLNTTEHSDVFARNLRVSHDTTEAVSAHKPSPRRTLTESVGSRHIQEDGKKLMAKAGKFGGKAGIAAKGLFAKGKEKMRNASSGEKGRRKSTGLSSTDSNEVLHDQQSQPREPTFLDGPPQIPFTLSPASPLESSNWFAKSNLSLDDPTATRQTGDATSSNSSFLQEKPIGDPTKSTATPASPAISALVDDDQSDKAGIPSRSISQLTRPTADDSPLESPLRGTAEREVGREGPPALSHQHLNAPVESAITNLNAPGPFPGQIHGPRSDVHSSDRSLQVPDDRRRSIISDVSSASPGPGPESDKQIRRSVSPADDVPASQEPANVEKPDDPVESDISTDNQLPGYEQIVSEPVDLPPEKSVLDGPPPGIDDPYYRRESNPNLYIPQPATAQHTDPTPSTNQYETSNDGPPSLLTSGDDVEQNRQLQGAGSGDFGKASEPPLSPVSQALSKEMSQVSVDEFDQANAAGQRQSRSYSRPFSADPNVRNHPAFKTSEPEQPNIDRAQMYSSESPLPSARRNPEDVDRLRQQIGSEQFFTTQSTQEESPSAGAYRIPGPYIQNYRSPKQITTPRVGRSETQVEASGQPLPSTLRSQQQEQERQHQQYQSQQQYQQQLQQEQLYQQYQQQQQAQPQGPFQPPLKSQIMQESGRPPFIPEQSRAEHDHQHYREYMPTNSRQYSYEGDNPSHRLSQQPDQLAQRQQQAMGPLPAPTPQTTSSNPPTARKKSTFGSFFGGGSKSKLKKQERLPAPVPENQDVPQKDKRASIFRRNSRHDSISSQQSSQYGGQDQIGQLPTWNTTTQSGRRQSKDILRTSSNEAKEHPVEKEKKKRFSGLGSKLFKSGSSAKPPAAASPALPQPQMGTKQPYQQQYTAQNYMSPQNTYGQYSGDAWTTQEQQPPAQFQRGYSHSSQQPEAQHEFPRGPQQQFSQPQRAFTQPVQQRRPDSQYDYSTTPSSQPESHYPTATSPFQYSSGMARGIHPSMQPVQPGVSPHPGNYSANITPYLNPDQRRPSDLRIDTNTPNHSSHSIPATAPAQVYPNRGSSLSPTPPRNVVPRPYADPSPGFTSTTAPLSAAASSTKPGPGRNHVMDLHKRSRSPKLGRKNSSEDFDAQRRQEQENGLAATGLGTFISKRISPVGGVPRPDSDQERPYAIDLPGLDEDAGQSQAAGHRRTRTMSPIPPSVQQNTLGDPAAARSGTPVSLAGTAMDVGTGATIGGTGTYSRAIQSDATDGLVSRSGTSAAPQHQQTGKAIARDKSVGGAAVELPGSKPDGYESEEEVLMSATAYPGQEWMPTFVGDGRWDD
ncbi:uncharacterized protein A1O9_06480 [Exophiala aquamarina CBS 119918]|uniref:Uncharacterized protein n=1 Tax=Exophiala aquamarina CBS 119918 TaxID=1182545 RepID=A0A072PEL1_9EURO|nr:uncharacterized protein A1O9_06480 [Exophiala aquamarina CBS 119918]KEF58554.1 hypothetical protein A1O9_06480 [Exophiala aquamarina CBS 119918]